MANFVLLGDVALDALCVSSFDTSRSWNWVSHETIADLPPLQRVGKKPRQPKIGVRIHPLLGASTSLVLAQLEALGEKGEPVPLQLGNGFLLGWFVIEQIDQPWDWATANGTPISMVLQVQLRESRPPEAPAQIPVGVFDFAQPERTTPEQVDSTGNPNDVPLSQIARA
jgi:phage protein U